MLWKRSLASRAQQVSAGSMTVENDELSDIDTLANAVTFWTAARTLIQTDTADEPKPLSAILALLGFSIENGLKTILQFRDHQPLKSWKHSHDLRDLRMMAADYGLSISGASTGIIDALSPYHEAHLFRYPKKMPGTFPSPNKILSACDELLRKTSILIELEARRRPTNR